MFHLFPGSPLIDLSPQSHRQHSRHGDKESKLNAKLKLAIYPLQILQSARTRRNRLTIVIDDLGFLPIRQTGWSLVSQSLLLVLLESTASITASVIDILDF